MLKLVIVTSDLLKSKELINNSIGKIYSLQIIGILSNKSELENFRKKRKFDFLLFHNFDYLDYLNEDYDIICINNFKTPVKKYDNRISLSNNNSFEEIKKHLEKFTFKITKDIIKEKSTQILLKFGFSLKHIGTKYLIEAISYSYIINFDNSFENLEKNIYPYIAKLNDTNVDNVKWSIARSINLMYLNHTTKSIVELENYFYLDHLEKPTPKLVISIIRNKLLFEFS